jgi:membrane protein
MPASHRWIPAVLPKVRQVIACAVRRWLGDNASSSAAALAFYCAFSLAPLLVIVLMLAGWIVDAEAAELFVERQMSALLGPDTAPVLMEAVRASQRTEGYAAAVISVVTLGVAATTVLAALEEVLDRIWGQAPRAVGGIGGWMRRRIISLGFILAISFMLLVTLTLSTVMAGLREWFAQRHAAMVGLVGALDMLISFGLTTGLFALIYRYMPGRRLPWKVVVGGGLVTAVLFVLGKWAVGLYLARSTVPTAFGAAASFAALLLWLYYTAQILLLGAEVTACMGGLTRTGSQNGGPGGKMPEKFDRMTWQESSQ